MSWRITYLFLFLLSLDGLPYSDSRKSFGKLGKESAAGSGGWALHDSDDEDFTGLLSGSGSGLGRADTEVDETKFTSTSIMYTTTDHPLTDCENMRQTSQSLRGRYAPRCLSNGDFDSLQCHGYPGTSECWCSDLRGREIPGTLMEAPNYPNCDNGNNLPPCVYMLVKHIRSKLVGNFRPQCAVDGQFDKVQCQGSLCFCVDESTGKRVHGTEVHISQKPKCGADSTDVQAPDTSKRPAEGNNDINGVDEQKPSTPRVNVHIGHGEDADKGDDQKEEYERGGDEVSEDNKTGEDKGVTYKSGNDDHHADKVEKASEIMSQPGILAGIIGGSVVLLLCLVLLIMFLIYRMRKKDEGSYPLDEPRKTPNYNYVRAPEKEFYA